jgi:hypothetical protein
MKIERAEMMTNEDRAQVALNDSGAGTNRHRLKAK